MNPINSAHKQTFLLSHHQIQRVYFFYLFRLVNRVLTIELKCLESNKINSNGQARRAARLTGSFPLRASRSFSCSTTHGSTHGLAVAAQASARAIAGGMVGPTGK